jgi:sugar lactone lactonase YvrE
MSTQAELVVDARCGTGESPVWSTAEQALYWVDIPARTLNRWHASEGHAKWTAGEMIACIAPRADAPGAWIAGMESGLFSLAPQAGGTLAATALAPVAHAVPAMRFNDGRCDRQGRFWAGTMFRDMAAARPDGRLYRYDAQGLSGAVVSELVTQNGLAFSPDGRTMYLSDSHPTRRRVWAFDYDTADGVPHNRRLFADMAGYTGRPDGAAIDADGCYWVAGNDGGCLLRFTPQGELDRTIALPMAKPAMCSFGGPGMDTMLVTSIDPGNGAGGPMAGAVLLLRPGVQGVPEAPFPA